MRPDGSGYQYRRILAENDEAPMAEVTIPCRPKTSTMNKWLLRRETWRPRKPLREAMPCLIATFGLNDGVAADISRLRAA